MVEVILKWIPGHDGSLQTLHEAIWYSEAVSGRGVWYFRHLTVSEVSRKNAKINKQGEESGCPEQSLR